MAGFQLTSLWETFSLMGLCWCIVGYNNSVEVSEVFGYGHVHRKMRIYFGYGHSSFSKHCDAVESLRVYFGV
ncbi:hypothetical protein M758_3G258800 [Ceratodon purpureus]|nr:hypothetical protein M758_3G258800 [Ceratodon purpureus]